MEISPLKQLFLENKYDEILKSEDLNEVTNLFIEIYPHYIAKDDSKFLIKVYQKIEILSFSKNLPPELLRTLCEMTIGDADFTSVAFKTIEMEGLRLNLHRLAWITSSIVLKKWFQNWEGYPKNLEFQGINYETLKYINDSIYKNAIGYDINNPKLDDLERALSIYEACEYLGILDLKEKIEIKLRELLENMPPKEEAGLLKKAYLVFAKINSPLQNTVLKKFGLSFKGFKFFGGRTKILQLDHRNIIYDHEMLSLVFSQVNPLPLVDVSWFSKISIDQWLLNREYFKTFRDFFYESEIKPSLFIKHRADFENLEQELHFMDRLHKFGPQIVSLIWKTKTYYKNNKLESLLGQRLPLFEIFLKNSQRLENVYIEDSDNVCSEQLLETLLVCPSLKKIAIDSTNLQVQWLCDFFKKIKAQDILLRISFDDDFKEMTCSCKHLSLAGINPLNLKNPIYQSIECFFEKNPQLHSLTFFSNEHLQSLARDIDSKRFKLDTAVTGWGVYRFKNPIRIVKLESKKRDGISLESKIKKKLKTV